MLEITRHFAYTRKRFGGGRFKPLFAVRWFARRTISFSYGSDPDWRHRQEPRPAWLVAWHAL